MDGDHVILGLTGNAKLGQTDDNALGHGEKGRAGFDGVDKPIHDPNLNDDDGKPRRKGHSSFFMFLPFSRAFFSKTSRKWILHVRLNVTCNW